MSITTLEQTLAAEALEERVEEAERRWQHVRTLRHEDGSVTIIEIQEYDQEFSNPRDHDGNVARLVLSDYCAGKWNALDQGDYGIEEARERWYGGWGYGDLSCDQSAMVLRYLSIFRPDVVHYEGDWSVNGCSQSDWQGGYGYVLQADMDEHLPTATARECFDLEVRVYGLYFAGEVYQATHLTVGEPIVKYGDHGAYVFGYDIEEDHCGGFLAYDDMADIALQFTSSPVVS